MSAIDTTSSDAASGPRLARGEKSTSPALGDVLICMRLGGSIGSMDVLWYSLSDALIQ
jgi:hypothetical protein